MNNPNTIRNAERLLATFETEESAWVDPQWGLDDVILDGTFDLIAAARAIETSNTTDHDPLQPVRDILDRLADGTKPPFALTKWIREVELAIDQISRYVYPDE